MPLVATEDLDPSVPPGARWTVWRDLALCALVVCAVALIVDFLVVASPRGKVRIGADAAAVVVAIVTIAASVLVPMARVSPAVRARRVIVRTARAWRIERTPVGRPQRPADPSIHMTALSVKNEASVVTSRAGAAMRS